MATSLQPPQAPKQTKKFVEHGRERQDEYFWLRQRDDKAVLKHLRAENAYTEKVMKPVEPLKNKLFSEMKARIKQDEASLPFVKKDYYYYHRFEKGKEYPIHCRKKGSLRAKEEIILDVNKLARGHKYFSVAGLVLNPHQDILAYSVDTVGRRKYTFYFKDLKTGKTLGDVIPEVTGNMVWASDGKTLFYSQQHPETLRSYRIYRHQLGAGATKLVYEEKDETFYVYVTKAKSEQYIFIHSGSTVSDEIRYLKADEPTADFKLFEPRRRDHEYSVEHGGDRFYILTNHRAKNFRVMETAPEQTAQKHWREIVPHNKDILIQNLEVFKDFLVLQERSEGLKRLHVFRRGDLKDHYIQFKDPTYVVDFNINPTYDSTILRYDYESLNRPESIFDYDMVKKKAQLKKQKKVLGGFKAENYKSERAFALAADGTRIPISIVYRKGFRKNGKAPLLQYGYGSYGMSMEPWFRSDLISLLDRGFAFAIAHIRGGSEMGRQWYEDGKLLNKANTFTDFIAVSEHLIAKKYTAADRLFAQGGSAGGLLMGAVMNLAPHLYKGILAGVPFVDVLTTMFDDSLPLTTAEYDEWGNPGEKKYYEYMRSYSPYDNIKKQKYPHLLITTGYHDSQVQYWEPAKWLLRLRENNTADTQLLMEVDMEAGHSGTTGRFSRLKEVALEYAFLLNLAGIKK